MATVIPPADDSQPLDESSALSVPADNFGDTSAPLYDTAGVSLQLDDIAAELMPALSEVQSAIDDIATGVAAELFDATSEVNTATADMIGTADGSMTEALVPVVGAIDKLSSAVETSLAKSAGELMGSDINYPLDATLQQQILAAGDDEMLTGAIPALAPSINAEVSPVGITESTGPAYIGSTDTGYGLTGVPYVPPVVPPTTPPVSPPPPPPPPVGGSGGASNYDWNATSIPVDMMGDMLATGVPYVPPPVPPAVPPYSPITPPADDKCCPPQQITVVAPPGTCPTPTAPPPPPVNVSVYVPPTPTVPPPPPPPPLPTNRLPDPAVNAQCADWDVADPCAVGSTYVSTQSPGETETLSGAKTRWALEDVLKFANGVLSIEMPGYQSIKAGVNLVAGHEGIEAFATTYYTGKKIANDLIDTLTGNCVQNKAAVASLAVTLGTAGWAESITGAPLRYLATSNLYQFQYLNPQMLIAQSDIDNLYLRSKIKDKTWECLTKAQGNLPQWHRAARDAKQALLTPDQLVQSWRRGYITDVDLYDTLAENGFINSNYITQMVKLSEMPLSPSDLVSCMKRDAFDPKVVEKYEYDKDFGSKFQGKAKEWAYWQGLSEEQFAYLWYAHWTIPSNTQLYEMYHRLRPDRKERREWEKTVKRGDDGNPADKNDKGPPVVTEQDVKEALEINDIAPAWVDRLLATSFHPITNSDASRMYMIGYFDDDDLTEAFLDNGYNREDAATLTEYWSFETAKRVRNQSGVLTPRKVVKLFKDGAINRNDARKYLEEVFPNDKQLDNLLSLAESEIAAEQIQSSAKYLRRSQLTGELTRVEVMAELRNLGVDQQAANRMTQVWEVESRHRSKEVTAMMLCKWRDRGLINSDEHVQRLVRLGYPENDARNIARVCDIDSAARRAKQQLKDTKEQQRQTKSNLLQDIAKYKKELAALLQQIADANEKLFGTDAMSGPDQPNKDEGGGGG